MSKEKKTTEISINASSGAEKVERIEEEKGEPVQKKVKKTVKAPASAKGDAAMGDSAKQVKKANAASSNGKAEKESAAAKSRVEAALARKEKQEAKKAARKQKAAQKAEARKKWLAERKAKIEKRAAEKKARAEKHAAERKALAEKRKAEKEERLRARAHAKANKNNAKYEKKKAQDKRKKERGQSRAHREGNKSYGGWIAAVVSLGVVSLALATTVTVGAVEMNRNQSMMMDAQRSTMYELTGIMENVEGDLDRVRISNTPAQQSRILTDLLVQARLAELDLEKLPCAAETDRNVTGFINRTAAECERMLAKLRKGDTLSERDKESLEHLYAIQQSVRAELNELVQTLEDKDMLSFMKKGEGMVKDALDRIEKSTLDENMLEKRGKMAGAGMEEIPPVEKKEKKPHIEAATAEQLCAQYFAGYNIGDFQCIGETVARGYEAYNIQGYDEKGNQLFAEVSQTDGALLRFDYYEDCGGNTFDIANAERIAEEFLEKLGYDDMEVARLRANGSTTDFTFVYEEDDVLFYADEIRVKVCRTRGVVSGFDATKYIRNHKNRKDVETKITLLQAREKLYKELSVEASRLVVLDTPMRERAAYEFLCSYNEEKYFVFIDGITGEEIAIVNVKTIL